MGRDKRDVIDTIASGYFVKLREVKLVHFKQILLIDSWGNQFEE